MQETEDYITVNLDNDEKFKGDDIMLRSKFDDDLEIA